MVGLTIALDATHRPPMGGAVSPKTSAGKGYIVSLQDGLAGRNLTPALASIVERERGAVARLGDHMAVQTNRAQQTRADEQLGRARAKLAHIDGTFTPVGEPTGLPASLFVVVHSSPAYPSLLSS